MSWTTERISGCKGGEAGAWETPLIKGERVTGARCCDVIDVRFTFDCCGWGWGRGCGGVCSCCCCDCDKGGIDCWLLCCCGGNCCWGGVCACHGGSVGMFCKRGCPWRGAARVFDNGAKCCCWPMLLGPSGDWTHWCWIAAGCLKKEDVRECDISANDCEESAEDVPPSDWFPADKRCYLLSWVRSCANLGGGTQPFHNSQWSHADGGDLLRYSSNKIKQTTSCDRSERTL